MGMGYDDIKNMRWVFCGGQRVMVWGGMCGVRRIDRKWFIDFDAGLFIERSMELFT